METKLQEQPQNQLQAQPLKEALIAIGHVAIEVVTDLRAYHEVKQREAKQKYQAMGIANVGVSPELREENEKESYILRKTANMLEAATIHGTSLTPKQARQKAEELWEIAKVAYTDDYGY